MLTCIKLYSSHIHTKRGTEFEFVLLICNQNSIRIYGSICSKVDSVYNLTLSFVYALFCYFTRERERESSKNILSWFSFLSISVETEFYFGSCEINVRYTSYDVIKPAVYSAGFIIITRHDHGHFEERK